MKTVTEAFAELLAEDQQDGEPTEVLIVATPFHMELFIEYYPKELWEWEKDLEGGCKEVCVILNNECCITAFILKGALS